MGTATERLTDLVDSDGRYDIPHEELRGAQIEAMNERLRERRGAIKLLARRAEDGGIDQVRGFEDMVPLLFPHTAYKSYPERFLTDERWDRMGRWLDTLSTYRVPPQDPTQIDDLDDWVQKLQASGHYVSCSSGTTGSPAMLVASAKDLDWCRKEAPATYSCGLGVKLSRDRRMFGMSSVAVSPRNMASGEGFQGALEDPSIKHDFSALPPSRAPLMTIGEITRMIVLRNAIADGSATPSDIQRYETMSADRQEAMSQTVVNTAKAVIDARESKLHLAGLWQGLFEVARIVRDSGYGAADFHPENSMFVAGGLKRANLPDDYRDFVAETFNIAPEHTFQNYSMQELHSAMPRCVKGGRYHVPPWVVPLVLDKEGDSLLPVEPHEYEGRAAFFDLSIDGRWGGVISGDKIAIDYGPCPCGQRGPTVADTITRYADIEGDDKIGCAGTIDAYVRGVA